MKALLAMLLLISLASATLPSDEIRRIAAMEVLDLQHIDPAAPKALAAQDGNLSMHVERELPNLGHYCTWADTEVQDEAVLTDSQKSILGEVPSNRTNENITIINSTTADQLVYL